jgi:hypothetical protein
MSQETIDLLLDEIEQTEAEIEEQREFIVKLKQDEEDEGNDNTIALKKARLTMKNMEAHLKGLQYDLEIEQAEEDGDVLVTIGDQTLSVPILSLESLSDIPN